MAMTLEHIRDELRSFQRGRLQPSDWFAYCEELADAIDVHITQPAQAVDVDSLYEVIRGFGYTTRGQSDEIAEAVFEHITTRALAGEKAGWRGGLDREARRCVGAFAQFAGTSAKRCDPQAMHLVICEAHHGLSANLPTPPTDGEG